MEKPRSVEEAQHILEKKGISREIIKKKFFGVPVKIIKLRDDPKEYLIGVQEGYLEGLTIISKNNFEIVSGAGKTVAYLARAYFLRNKKTENRKYANLKLKYLLFTKALAEVEAKEFAPIIEDIISEEIESALKLEDKNTVDIDIEEFKELAEELKAGLEEYF
ncbi:MAG: hypothetical protein ACTSQY_09050 [Candidatus Odinarchaeia archaeon]